MQQLPGVLLEPRGCDGCPLECAHTGACTLELDYPVSVLRILQKTRTVTGLGNP